MTIKAPIPNPTIRFVFIVPSLIILNQRYSRSLNEFLFRPYFTIVTITISQILFIPELQTIMMEGVAYPGAVHPVGCQALVVLQPDLLIFERVGFSKFAANVPGQRVNLPALLDVLDDDRQVGFFP